MRRRQIAGLTAVTNKNKGLLRIYSVALIILFAVKGLSRLILGDIIAAC